MKLTLRAWTYLFHPRDVVCEVSLGFLQRHSAPFGLHFTLAERVIFVPMRVVLPEMGDDK